MQRLNGLVLVTQSNQNENKTFAFRMKCKFEKIVFALEFPNKKMFILFLLLLLQTFYTESLFYFPFQSHFLVSFHFDSRNRPKTFIEIGQPKGNLLQKSPLSPKSEF